MPGETPRDRTPPQPLRDAARAAWQGWTRVARRIGDVQARLLLTLFYALVLGPFGLVLRGTSDPLAIKPGAPRGWRRRTEGHATALEQARRQA